jgi:hypothetical protein
VVEAQPQWFETLSETERDECSADLTDAYFAALTMDAWNELTTIVQQWRQKAEREQAVAV